MTSNESKSVEVFSAMDFLSTFFSVLKTKNINVISGNKLFSVIGKYRDEFLNLFVDIDVTDNGETICSSDLEEGISMLQILGAISKTNPKFERIILKMNKDAAKEIIRNCPPEYRDIIEDFSEVFLREIEE